MAPAIHLFRSRMIAAKTTANSRDGRWVPLAGGLSDLIPQIWGRLTSLFYFSCHHFLLPGLAGGRMAFAQRRRRVAVLALSRKGWWPAGNQELQS